MSEILHLVIQCIYNWVHGFKTKTGGELWFARQAMWLNNEHLRAAAAAKRVKHEK